MAPQNSERPAPVTGNRPLQCCRAGERDSIVDATCKPKTQARLQAEQVWATLTRRFEVVVRKRRRP